MKRKVYNFINNNPYFIKLIYGLIILNVIAIILESYKEIRIPYYPSFRIFEIFSVIIFTIEYLLRFWTSDLENNLIKNSIKKRLKFVYSTYGLIDLLAILPFYLPFILPFDLRALRILRLFRLLRVFKLGRYSKSLKTISSVLRETKSDLAITLFIIFILLTLSSTLMYYIENDAQPEKFASIGHAFWWAISTLTTVGYGDVYPITAIGKFLSAIIALIGIGFVALPTGIISSAFIEKLRTNKEQDFIYKCPYCQTEFKYSKNQKEKNE